MSFCLCGDSGTTCVFLGDTYVPDQSMRPRSFLAAIMDTQNCEFSYILNIPNYGFDNPFASISDTWFNRFNQPLPPICLSEYYYCESEKNKIVVLLMCTPYTLNTSVIDISRPIHHNLFARLYEFDEKIISNMVNNFAGRFIGVA